MTNGLRVATGFNVAVVGFFETGINFVFVGGLPVPELGGGPLRPDCGLPAPELGGGPLLPEVGRLVLEDGGVPLFFG
jgi:hypothetical protein